MSKTNPTVLKALRSLSCTVSFLLMASPLALPQAREIRGNIVGRVFKEDGRAPSPGVTVRAHHATRNESFTSQPTDRRGDFFIADVPQGVYTFDLLYSDRGYAVEERVDARSESDFVLKACFRLVSGEGTAYLMKGECDPELPSYLAQDTDQKRLLMTIVIVGGAAAATGITLRATRQDEVSPVQ